MARVGICEIQRDDVEASSCGEIMWALTGILAAASTADWGLIGTKYQGKQNEDAGVMSSANSAITMFVDGDASSTTGKLTLHDVDNNYSKHAEHYDGPQLGCKVDAVCMSANGKLVIAEFSENEALSCGSQTGLFLLNVSGSNDMNKIESHGIKPSQQNVLAPKNGVVSERTTLLMPPKMNDNGTNHGFFPIVRIVPNQQGGSSSITGYYATNVSDLSTIFQSTLSIVVPRQDSVAVTGGYAMDKTDTGTFFVLYSGGATHAPTAAPTAAPTHATAAPTTATSPPSTSPTSAPTLAPTGGPTSGAPTTHAPTDSSYAPTHAPTLHPTHAGFGNHLFVVYEMNASNPGTFTHKESLTFECHQYSADSAVILPVSASISGDASVITVGCPGNSANKGEVLFFYRNSSGFYIQSTTTTLSDSNATASKGFGSDVSLDSSGSTLAVASSGDGVGTLATQWQLYVGCKKNRNCTLNYRFRGNATPSNGEIQARNRVQMSLNGRRVMVTMPLNASGEGPSVVDKYVAGQIVIYQKSQKDDDNWATPGAIAGIVIAAVVVLGVVGYVAYPRVASALGRGGNFMQSSMENML